MSIVLTVINVLILIDKIVNSTQVKIQKLLDQRALVFKELDFMKLELLDSDQACQTIIPKIKERLVLVKDGMERLIVHDLDHILDLSLLVNAYEQEQYRPMSNL